MVGHVTLHMALKDYYSILGVQAGAQNEDIKRAYRKLALVHHPDRNKDDPYAAAYFHEIKEAYETLIDPVRKDHYLQQRWYAQSMGKKFADLRPLTPETVLNDAIQLNKYVHSLNLFRVDKEGLAAYINNLLNSETVSMLENYESTDTKKEICRLILQALNPLETSHITPIAEKLRKISAKDPEIMNMINQRTKQKNTMEKIRRYEVPVMLMITLLICLVIWKC